ncbi:MAG: SPOR domain-containing protein [Candidatus Omnitrophica bacterium]|nr:SPOR domain-containing protein [Candidatus Omnitrophota bacterium]
MSYKNREVQPELFCTVKKKQNGLQKSFFQEHFESPFSISCDTLIVIIIALLMVNLSSFVLGVEKGKSQAKAENENIIEKKQIKLLAVEPSKQIKPVPALRKRPEEIINNKAPETEMNPVIETARKGYIIQLVTYSSNSNADKEAEKLRAQGYSSYVQKSGEYYVVYSGMYESRTSAIEKLPRLKKHYKDCFVRLLKKT